MLERNPLGHKKFLKRKVAGLEPGTYVPRYSVVTHEEQLVDVHDVFDGRSGLLVMLSTRCGLCPEAAQALRSFVTSYPDTFVFALWDATTEEIEIMRTEGILTPGACCSMLQMIEHLGTSGVPWVYTVNSVAQIVKGGPFNIIDHLLPYRDVLVRAE